MIPNLNGNMCTHSVPTDKVVRTVQALIAAGYTGSELLDAINELCGEEENKVIRTINYDIPETQTSIAIENPKISPLQDVKVGDCVIGTNSSVGEISDILYLSNGDISSITVDGLGYRVVSYVLPTVSTTDDNKTLTVKNGQWDKSYANRTLMLDVYASERADPTIIFNDRYIDGNISTDRTNRSISVDAEFVPYTSEDTTVYLRFSDDDDSDIRLIGIKDPVNSHGAANKHYVDTTVPLCITFSGTTDDGNASCDTGIEIIDEAISSNRPIIARYLHEGVTYYLTISTEYNNGPHIFGEYLHFDALPTIESYLHIIVIMDGNSLVIYFYDV